MDSPQTQVRLSKREKQAGDLLLQGCDNKTIGQEMGVAHRTVKAFMKRMFDKFGIDNNEKIKRVELALILYRRSA